MHQDQYADIRDAMSVQLTAADNAVSIRNRQTEITTDMSVVTAKESMAEHGSGSGTDT